MGCGSTAGSILDYWSVWTLGFRISEVPLYMYKDIPRVCGGPVAKSHSTKLLLVSSTHFQSSNGTRVLGCLCVIVSVCLTARFVAGVYCQLKDCDVLQGANVSGYLRDVRLVKESHKNCFLVVYPGRETVVQ